MTGFAPGRREVIAMLGAAGLGVSTGAAAAAPAGPRRSFRPGEVWLDTAGKPIQAHGGSLLQVGDLFWWYGENKERTDGRNGIWHWGVRGYSSRDLYNWDDRGLLIPPAPDDPASPMYPKKGMDRPHIYRDAATGKLLCWVKVMEDPHQTRSVFVADAITGPWRLVHRAMMPLGMNAGDFDIAVASEDGKAYMYFERVHSEMICADLTPEGTDFTGYYSTHFPRPGPPSVREAPAHFVRGGRQYLATSGTTGYFPNPSQIAVAETFHGPWTTLGDLHPTDRTRTSFNSQISCIFKHPAKRDLYIAMADRWLGPLSGPDYESGKLSALIDEGFRQAFTTQGFDPKHPPFRPEVAAAMERYAGLGIDTSLARYVWLPVRFAADGRPTIEWRDEWSLDEFA